nr:hypothetical protein [Streptomyces sp. TLI_235]
MHRLRENTKPTARPPVPKVREVTGLILTPPTTDPKANKSS